MKRANSIHKYLDNIARTVKGKGVPFMEDKLLWIHRNPQEADFANALKEIEENCAKIM